jgi:Cys-rich protein (TIGR01571 family)
MIVNTQPVYSQLNQNSDKLDPLYVHSPLQQPIPVFDVIDSNEEGRDWKIKLCECGDPLVCIYSCCCPKCALADARGQLDGSNWIVNLLCVSPLMARWMTRTAYNIPGNAHQDCWSGAFLPWCAINQMLQTTRHYGRAPMAGVGPEFNLNNRIGVSQRSNENLFYDACYSVFCSRCAVGYASMSIGMPFWLGCCCMNVFEVNSAIRYHHRIRPMWDNEIWLDCTLPVVGMLNDYLNWAINAAYVTSLLAEENTKKNRTFGYGFEFGTCWGYMCDYYQRGCVCSEPEGRYLMNDHYAV